MHIPARASACAAVLIVTCTKDRGRPHYKSSNKAWCSCAVERVWTAPTPNPRVSTPHSLPTMDGTRGDCHQKTAIQQQHFARQTTVSICDAADCLKTGPGPLSCLIQKTCNGGVCYMDIFAKQQWHCPPGSSRVNLISCDPPRWFAPPTPD
jgi:hypothetical protein